MDFARQQRDPTRHLIGITIVIVVHVLVIYALMTGLVRKGIEVVKKPLSATIIEEVKLPPPPPPPPPSSSRRSRRRRSTCRRRTSRCRRSARRPIRSRR